VTVKTIHEIPKDLPPARIFLDDIEELERIFRDLPPPQYQSADPYKIEFESQGKRSDSITDLHQEKLGLRTKDFTMSNAMCSWRVTENRSRFPCDYSVSEDQKTARLRACLGGCGKTWFATEKGNI
jgi:hypothetical protein